MDYPGLEYRQRKDLSPIMPLPMLGSTQPLTKWVPVSLFAVGKAAGTRSWPHLHLVPRLRMNGARYLPPFPSVCFHDVCGDNFSFYSYRKVFQIQGTDERDTYVTYPYLHDVFLSLWNRRMSGWLTRTKFKFANQLLIWTLIPDFITVRYVVGNMRVVGRMKHFSLLFLCSVQRICKKKGGGCGFKM